LQTLLTSRSQLQRYLPLQRLEINAIIRIFLFSIPFKEHFTFQNPVIVAVLYPPGFQNETQRPVQVECGTLKNIIVKLPQSQAGFLLNTFFYTKIRHRRIGVS
jgi:hypothetical protein